MTKTSPPKFPLGRVVITANASQQLDMVVVNDALRRHAAGDWGDICPEDACENEHSLKKGFRLHSVYGSGRTAVLDHHRRRPLRYDHPHAGRLLTNRRASCPPKAKGITL